MAWVLSWILLAHIVVSTTGADIPWYTNAVIYQIYPRSFLDLDKDGIGDLKGILQKADYLASLGISAVWLTPIYPSPNEDFGYDITDYMEVNPEYGTVEDFANLVKAFKAKGIRVLLDFVPNHTSTRHPWFVQSEQKKSDSNENFTDYYVWRDQSGYDNKKPVPPNNWLSAMNTGSAWKWSEKRQQYYLHTFLEHQADLNYQNPIIHKKMEEILKFWMHMGVDGFRIDSVNWIFEDQEFKDEPKSKSYDSHDQYNYKNLDHIYTMDQPSDVQFVQMIRSIVDEYTHYINDTDNRLVFLQHYAPLEKLLPYYGDENNPGAIPFNFLLFDMKPDDSSAVWETKIKKYYKDIGKHEPTWVLGNHNWNRVANRWSEDWVDLLHIITMTLKGTVITYYGEEIGLKDNMIRWDQLKDPQGIIAGQKKYITRSRDFERAPFPWENSQFGGFTQAPTTWIPLAPDYWSVNVKAQESASLSHLKVYRALTKLRKELTFIHGDLDISSNNDILYIIRSLKDNPTYIAILNLGDFTSYANVKALKHDYPDVLKLHVSSINYPGFKENSVNAEKIHLPPKTGVIVSTSN